MAVSVTIRMYCMHDMGDCFLLFFHDPARAEPRTILIDCGVLFGAPDADTRMRQIASNIAGAVNHHLDVLVVTHEHWDHISGFVYALDIFKTITIDQVWLGWTEKPGDPAAKVLQTGRKELQTRLNEKVQAQLLRLGGREAPRLAAICELMSFNSLFSARGSAGGAAGLMQMIAGLSQPNQVEYLRPGGPPMPLADLEGVRIFVLGPPLEEKYMRMSSPSAGQVYGLTADSGLTSSLAASRLGLTEGQLAWLLPDVLPPFDFTETVPLDRAAGNPAFAAYYNGPAWRRIDASDTELVEQLALRLADDTNNTSLVLAIELEESGQVLLFPGDAQVGSWESWKDLEFGAGGRQPVKAADLLARTVFYKVGHHGSVNATLRNGGLEWMTSPNLVAAIPVYEERARLRKWEMPARGLYNVLLQKTAGRILRMDQPGQAFLSNVEGNSITDPLYVEYRVGEGRANPCS